MKKRVLLAAVLAVTVLFGACKPYVPDELSWLMESGEIVDSIADQSEEPESVMGDLMNQIESANEAASESLSSTPSIPQTAQMRGVWISYIELSSFAGSSQSTFTTKIASMMETCKQKEINTVFVQVRPFGDAIYPSKLFPWSRTVSGQTGKALSYDPMQIIVAQARAQGLSVHAWINPYRLMNDANMKLVDDSYAIGKWYNASNRSDYMVNVSGTWWLKPGNAEVRSLITAGAKELLTNYAIDGIHIDDYFYADAPSKYGDTTAQAKANNTALVKSLYQTVKSVRSSAQFGVSPAGGFRADSKLPASDTGYLSTDLALWCSKSGYIDYVMPQIYWDYAHTVQPFTMTLEKWKSFVTASSVKLYIGLAPYKYGSDIIERQKADSVSGKASGWCLYRYDNIK